MKKKKTPARRKAATKTTKATKSNRYPNVETEFKFVPYVVAGLIALFGIQMAVKATQNRGPASNAEIRPITEAVPGTPRGKFAD
jgi:hypothetical protein